MQSLAGLDGLRGGDVVKNIGILNNVLLSNISALAGLFRCQPNGGTLLNASMVVGLIVVHPKDLQAINHGCTLQTPDVLCKYIADNTQCPQGTEYIANRNGTFSRVYQTLSNTTPPGISPVSSVESNSPLPSLPTNFGGG